MTRAHHRRFNPGSKSEGRRKGWPGRAPRRRSRLACRQAPRLRRRTCRRTPATAALRLLRTGLPLAAEACYAYGEVTEQRLRFLRDIARRTGARAGREADRAERLRRERRAAGLAEAHRLALRFAEVDPELREVVLFGSLATGEVGNRQPDVDLAVESSRYLRLVAIALDSRFKVDVVDLATARPAIRQAVARHGKVIYARPNAP